jgi:hypothetical protein
VRGGGVWCLLCCFALFSFFFFSVYWRTQQEMRRTHRSLSLATHTSCDLCRQHAFLLFKIATCLCLAAFSGGSLSSSSCKCTKSSVFLYCHLFLFPLLFFALCFVLCSTHIRTLTHTRTHKCVCVDALMSSVGGWARAVKKNLVLPFCFQIRDSTTIVHTHMCACVKSHIPPLVVDAV